MLRRLFFGCKHQFSWPLKLPDGSYYQVCVRCGVEYSYDWANMRRTGLLPVGHRLLAKSISSPAPSSHPAASNQQPGTSN